MSFRFHFPERLISAAALTLLLILALGRSPLWTHLLPPVAESLPERYTGLLDLLPGDTNTALAFLVLLAVNTGGFLVPRHPLIVPSAATALVLGYTTYPWGLVHWHRLIFDIAVTPNPPSILDWLLFALPVVLLLAIPALLQIRAVVARYRAKGAPRHEIPAVERHLLQQALRNTGTALAIVLGLGLLLHLVAARVPATGLLIANSVLVLLVVTALIVAALAVGTGLLSAPRKAKKAQRS